MNGSPQWDTAIRFVFPLDRHRKYMYFGSNIELYFSDDASHATDLTFRTAWLPKFSISMSQCFARPLDAAVLFSLLRMSRVSQVQQFACVSPYFKRK